MGEDMKKEYLGDGAYVEFDGYHLILTAEDGIRTTNAVYLEPGALASLENYLDRLKGTPLPEVDPKQRAT